MKLPSAILACSLLLGALTVAAPPVQLADFTLKDQHGATRAYHFPKARVTVMTLADWRGSEQLEPWIQRVFDRYGQRLDIDGVADLSMVPKPLQAMVQRAFKGKLTYSVMLDWTGPVVRQFPRKPAVANLYVIDRRGRIVAQHSGPVNDSAAAALFGVIDRTLAAAR